MSRIAVFSDLHGHAFRPYATILSNGLNSRLADAVGCIDQVHQYAVENDVDLVLFGGDLFHIRRSIYVQAFNAVYESMAKFSMDKIPVVMIPGNHDQADREGEDHSVHAFRSFLTVIDQPGWHTVLGRKKHGEAYSIMAIPYMEAVDKIKAAVEQKCHDESLPTIFLGHLGVQGAKTGADFIYNNPADPTLRDLCPDQYDVGFLGHYHMHQELSSNFQYVGSPLHHNWGDKGQIRGFTVYDTDTKTTEFIPLVAPMFIESVGYPDDDALAQFDGNYVRVVTDEIVPDDVRVELLNECGALSLEFVPSKKETTNIITPRIAMAPGMSFTDMVAAYVKSDAVGASVEDRDVLINIGHSMLREAEEQ